MPGYIEKILLLQILFIVKCCLIITSRPTTSSHLHNLVDRRVEIVGFTDKDRLDYIQTALEGCTDQVDALKHYLQFNPTINALCYIPLNMTILLCLAEDGVNNLPKTQTNMYKRFIKTTIRQFIRKTDEKFVCILKSRQPLHVLIDFLKSAN